MHTKPEASSELVKKFVVEGLQEIKGQNITVLDLREIENAVTDFFIIAEIIFYISRDGAAAPPPESWRTASCHHPGWARIRLLFWRNGFCYKAKAKKKTGVGQA